MISSRVDTSDAYWRCEKVKTETVLPMNGGRLYLDHVAKVLRARLLRDLVAVPADPNTTARGAA